MDKDAEIASLKSQLAAAVQTYQQLQSAHFKLLEQFAALVKLKTERTK